MPPDLKQYATDALLVWGNETDFKHFLPRIFELAVAHGEEFVDPQIVFHKLRHADWRYWPMFEQSAIEHFFDPLCSRIHEVQPHEYYGC